MREGGQKGKRRDERKGGINDKGSLERRGDSVE